MATLRFGFLKGYNNGRATLCTATNVLSIKPIDQQHNLMNLTNRDPQLVQSIHTLYGGIDLYFTLYFL